MAGNAFAIRARNAAFLTAVLAALAACATKAPAPPATTAAIEYQAEPGLTPAQRVARAVALLEAGQAVSARVELAAALAQAPANTQARKLLGQIDKDPKALLGEQAFAYTLKAGDTLPILAQKHLGDRLMFWALARYNEIPVPDAVVAGQTIRIPGVLKAAPSRAKPRTTAPTRTAKPATAPQPARNPARARELRAAALELLNRGQVGRATPMLQQALSLDPGNALITRDLDRARRLAAAR